MNYSITAVHDAIIAAFQSHFPKVTVKSYETELMLHEITPACLLDIEEFSKGVSCGDGRYSVTARIAVHCVLGQEVSNVLLRIREFAVAVSTFVDEEGLWIKGCTEKAKRIDAMPGNFSNETSMGYESWVVSWDQVLNLGESKWGEEEVRDGVAFAVNSDDEAEFVSVKDAPAY